MGTVKRIGASAILLCLAPLLATAQDSGASSSYASGYLADVNATNTSCDGDLSSCGSLMVNDSGDTTQVSLIMPDCLRDSAYSSYAGGDRGDRQYRAVVDDEKMILDLDDTTLARDFLRGVSGSEGGATFVGRQSNRPGSGNEPDWGLAAASSMQNYSSASTFNRLSASGAGCDFQHTYQWRVDNRAWENGEFSIEQVSIDSIRLGPARDGINPDLPPIDCGESDPDSCVQLCIEPGSCGSEVAVPIPGTVFLTLMGLGILGGRRALSKRSVRTAGFTPQ